METNFQNEILHSLAEGVFSVDEEFRIKFFNDAAERITGLNRNDVIGKYCKNVFKSKYCDNRCPIVRVLESGKTIYDFDSKIQCKDQTKDIRLNAVLLKNDSTKIVGGVITFREIEQQQNVEKYLIKNTHFYGIVGFSREMEDIFDLILEISSCNASALITGETGTGKELIADAIQATSLRKDKPYVKVNCAVLPPNLLASELFGHVKGAFTDALKDRIGRFELANNGTIFLDEIGEMPPQMQMQLLRVIQDGTFEKVGESITRKVDVRIIAATNVNIEKAIKEGKFREDLFFRLNVIPIHLPPLQNRREDILFLANHFLKKFSLIYQKEIPEMNDEVIDSLSNYTWPGNVRELENAIEYAFVRSRAGIPIDVCKLPKAIKSDKPCFEKVKKISRQKLQASEIVKILEKHKWNRSKAAEELEINRSTLWRYLKTFGIEG
ncbi:MAG: sigma 54-interacting transcriptional regulator [Ignavibacteriaceae bacterium]|nr:sigma 54-interacting transcriptional regulator [Ignavibacteriaceae bacterium]